MNDLKGNFDINAFANAVVMRKFPFPILANDGDRPPFILSLDSSLARVAAQGKLLLPELTEHTKTVLVFSDYGGESSNSQYATYSFLSVSYDAHEPVLSKLKELRKTHGLNAPFKEVCFKDFHYGPINRCLREWLTACDHLIGLLFTVIVDKKVFSLFGKNHVDSQKQAAAMMQQYGLGEWRPHVAEKMLRIMHVIGYWAAVIALPDRGLMWMTDQDAIVANPAKVEAVKRMFSGIINGYRPRTGKIAIALPFAKAVDMFGISDFLSVPDLVAGSIESLFTRTETMPEPTVKEEANEVLLWMCRQGIGLKKLTMTVKPGTDGLIETSMTTFGRRDGTEVGEMIPIYL